MPRPPSTKSPHYPVDFLCAEEVKGCSLPGAVVGAHGAALVVVCSPDGLDVTFDEHCDLFESAL